MKDGFKDIVGRQIAAVVVAANEKRPPRSQVFLVFTDDTCFELYGDAFTGCAGIDQADRIASYVKSAGGKIVRVYGKAQLDSTVATGSAMRGIRNEAPPETLAQLMSRDLTAWNAAKAVIAKAKGHPPRPAT